MRMSQNNATYLKRNGEVLLYNRKLNGPDSEIVGGQNFDDFGLTVGEDLIYLDRYYSVADRTAKFVCRFGEDTVAAFGTAADFRGNLGLTTTIQINVPEKTVQVAALPAEACEILKAGDTFLIAITKQYQEVYISVTNMLSGESAQYVYVSSGVGGAGSGAVGTPVFTGMYCDYYAMKTLGGAAFSVSQIIVTCAACDLLIYGDSITQPESYFPSDLFDQCWTKLIVDSMGGRAMASGRGGTQIAEIMKRIGNELPYIKPKYVMVTIGTNGGNTIENLTELVRYIKSQNAIPVLNHIPCYNNNGDTESFHDVNRDIDAVREAEGITGCDFDIATSVDYDGKTIDTTCMWTEEYTDGFLAGMHFFHHPNVKGSANMFARLQIDVPEIFQ